MGHDGENLRIVNREGEKKEKKSNSTAVEQKKYIETVELIVKGME